MNLIIFIIELVFISNFGIYCNPECIVDGESLAFIKGTLKVILECKKDVQIIGVGLTNFHGINFDFVSNTKNEENVNFYSRYFLNLKDNELNLMDVDRHLEDKKIFFLVRVDGKNEEYFYSSPIVIINQVAESVNSEKMIENGRYFTEEYIYDQKNNITIRLDEIEIKYGIEFGYIFYCKFEYQIKILKRIKDDSIDIIKYHKNLFHISKNSITISEIKDNFKDITLGFIYYKENFKKIACMKQVTFKIPLEIIYDKSKIISWKMTSILFHEIIINVFTIHSNNFLSLLHCNLHVAKLICDRRNGYKNIFNQISEDGLELNDKYTNSFILQIRFDIFQQEQSTYFEEEKYIDIASNTLEIEYFDLKESQFKLTLLECDMTNFYSSGILKIKLVYGPEFTPNKARFVEFLVKFREKYILLCSHFGDNFEEHPSIFSPFILSCEPKGISFYEIDIELFNNVNFAFRMKITSSESIFIESKRIEIVNKNQIVIPYKKINWNLNITYLRIKNRFFPLSFKLISFDSNTMNIDISTEYFSIISIGLCNNNNICEFKLTDNDNAAIHIGKSMVLLRNRTILLIGSPLLYTSKTLILKIFNGINTYSQGIYKFEFENIIEPVSCDGEEIIWKINFDKIKFSIYLEFDSNFLLLGECAFNRGCTEYTSDFIRELTFTGLKIDKRFYAKIINLKFEIFPLISSMKGESIEYKITYDLFSEECRNLTEKIITVLPNVSKDVVLRRQFLMNQNVTIIIKDESKKNILKYFFVIIGIILLLLIVILVTAIILLQVKINTKIDVSDFEIKG